MNLINKKKHSRSRSFRMSFLFGALLCAFLTTRMTGKAFSQTPRGVFCLLPVGAGAGQDPSVYYNVDVDGISVRQNWSDLEPSEDVYDWLTRNCCPCCHLIQIRPVVNVFARLQ